jgi:hypothetical protein
MTFCLAIIALDRIEPATFWFVAQSLNQLHYSVPFSSGKIWTHIFVTAIEILPYQVLPSQGFAAIFSFK